MGESIVYVSVDDWAGIYINGRLYWQGHSVPQFIWIEAINETNGFVRAQELSLNESAQEWVEGEGEFPYNLNEIPEEIRA